MVEMPNVPYIPLYNISSSYAVLAFWALFDYGIIGIKKKTT